VRRLILALGATLGLAACAAPTPLPQAPGLDGTWRAVSAERNGVAAPDLVGHQLIFGANRFRITRDGRLLFGGTFSVNGAAQPATIDFTQDEGPTMRGTWQGIYRVQDGRLEIVDNAADMTKSRPTQFSTSPGSGYVLVRFARGGS
jgi:uncharacterized protein (TIGR03067 family)